jgi:hypothetical protein
MEVTRDFIRTFTFITGPLVLISYAYALSRLEDWDSLWGGVLAAVGFLMYWWVALFQIDVAVFESLRWPWAESDGNGGQRLLLAYALFLIPSALWIDSTMYHMSNSYSWTPYLVIGILALASIGNIMFGLLAYGAMQDGVDGAGLMLLGSVFLGIQVIVNDLIVWSAKFPW